MNEEESRGVTAPNVNPSATSVDWEPLHAKECENITAVQPGWRLTT
jgi:hypothetical protein